jgi:hypothetical protein
MEKEEINDRPGQVSPDVGGGVEGADPPVRGRRAAVAAYRTSKPDAGDEIEDDALYDYLMDERKLSDERYGSLSGANARLAELVGSDPRLAAVMSMISGENPKSFPYSIARVYGKDFLSAEGEALDDFEKGYQEHLKELSESRAAVEAANKNIEEYQSTLTKFAEENSLSEEDVSSLHNAIYEDSMNILQGVIPREYIEYKWKGLNYDRDLQAAAQAGVTEGKNSRIDAKMKRVASSTSSAGGGSTSAAAGATGAPKKGFPAKKGSFFDEFKDVD